MTERIKPHFIVKEERVERLKQLFPEAFGDNKINWDSLKAALGEFLEDDSQEPFGLVWPGKRDARKQAFLPPKGSLKLANGEGINEDTTENLFIEGDNLEVLKLLQKSYFGKIKMIYIDPPYNTGNDFVYKDDFTDTIDDYLRKTGQLDEEGKALSTNPKTSGRFHSNWLNMMYPRLLLARNLLRDDGVIFVSIDDNEVQNLKQVMNEIFGEEATIGALIWKRRQNVDSRAKNGLSSDHEYLLIYGKKAECSITGGAKDMTKYSNPDNDPRGEWMSDNMIGLATKDQRPNLHYDLINPYTSITYTCPTTGWRYEPKRMKEFIKNDEIIWPSKIDGRPRRKKFKKDLLDEFTGFSSILSTTYNTQATREVRELFDDKEYFDFPKPKDLLKIIVTIQPINA